MKEVSVFLVDDNPDFLVLLSMLLQQQCTGLQISTYPSGDSVLEALEELDAPGYPALIILDLNMPGLGGIDVLQAIRRRPPQEHLPVVILTGSANAEQMQEAYTSRVNAVILKPASDAGLQELARNLCRFWLQPG